MEGWFESAKVSLSQFYGQHHFFGLDFGQPVKKVSVQTVLR